MRWVHAIVCLFLTVALIGIMGSPKYSKDVFMISLFIYFYSILILKALFKDVE